MRSSICFLEIRVPRVALGEIAGKERVSTEVREKREREARAGERRKEKRTIGKRREWKRSIRNYQIAVLGHATNTILIHEILVVLAYWYK